MSSNYRNFRNSVPWLILFLEAVFIVLFMFADYGERVSSRSYPGKISSLAVEGGVNAGFYFAVQQRWDSAVLCVC